MQVHPSLKSWPGHHLTLLLQARFDRLRHKASLRVEEFPDLVFCEDVVLEGVLAKDRSLGTIQTLAPGLPDTMMHVLSAFKTEGQSRGDHDPVDWMTDP